MYANGFDTLTKAVSRPSTRRRLVRLAAALPLAGAVASLLGEEHAAGRRKRKRACAKAGQSPNTGMRKGCCQGLTPDASGRCAAPDPGPTPDSCTGLKPTTTSPTQGLQEAIDGANPGATLTLCAGTWNLTETVEITRALTLVGAGAGKTVLDGGNAVRVLDINAGATATLRAVTITKGTGSGFGVGGGIQNDGTLILLGVSVTGNTGFSGAGIYNNSNSTLILKDGSRVTGNTVSMAGGGVFNFHGTMTMEAGSSVSNNTTTGNAGGILNNGALTLKDGSSVTDNASNIGGGIYNHDTVTLEAGSRVTGNTATNTGGGIYNYHGTVTLEGEDPSPIVVDNCQDNCAGTTVAKCAATPVSCS